MMVTYLVCQLGSHAECKLAYVNAEAGFREVICSCYCHNRERQELLETWRAAFPPRQYAKERETR